MISKSNFQKVFESFKNFSKVSKTFRKFERALDLHKTFGKFFDTDAYTRKLFESCLQILKTLELSKTFRKATFGKFSGVWTTLVYTELRTAVVVTVMNSPIARLGQVIGHNFKNLFSYSMIPVIHLLLTIK